MNNGTLHRLIGKDKNIPAQMSNPGGKSTQRSWEFLSKIHHAAID
jgi:hypothetical protein